MTPRLFATPLAFAVVFASVVALTFFTAAPPPAHSYSSGAPPMFSGPENYCNVCHTDALPEDNPLNSGTGSVTIDAPDTFAPGETITITVTVDNQSVLAGSELKQGFELSARDAALENVGTFTVDGTNVQFSQGVENYVTHTSASNTDDTWSFQWTAPATGAPPTVTLYVAGNAANGNGFPDEGDKIYSDTHELALTTANEPDTTPLAFRLQAPFPNPLRTGAATARYELDRPAEVEAVLRDGRGRVVRRLVQGAQSAGPHTLRIAADDLAAGTYYLTLSTPEGTQAQPLTVVR